ncbi:hypothetical protein ONE63_009275 [Megalurothrips usitatus]|uniref:Peptidase S1 domain-containing protein n=1 Tax=Megalurothrips usitatus TaxID=439358 RepID=A0AAV7XMH7_9NEOP|nr:hypothetical protein ONE63_009275 [Megalurothrips usitatus]
MRVALALLVVVAVAHAANAPAAAPVAKPAAKPAAKAGAKVGAFICSVFGGPACPDSAPPQDMPTRTTAGCPATSCAPCTAAAASAAGTAASAGGLPQRPAPSGPRSRSRRQAQAEELDQDQICAIFSGPTCPPDKNKVYTPCECSDGALSGCECVPYYQCDNVTGKVNTDGSGLIDIRQKPDGGDRTCEQQTGKCEHYLQYCCKLVNGSSGGNNPPDPTPSYPVGPDPTPTPRPRPRPDVHPTPPPQQDNYCGQRNPNGIDFRITGDADGEAEFGEFPWMTAILQEELVEQGEQCGGALITPQVVLTGAHCVANKNPRRLKIRAGEWDTQTTKEKYLHQDRGVAQVIVHPSFHPKSLHNDIALLILQDPVQIGGHIGLVCLPEQDQSFDFERECFASGWGKNKFAQDGQYQVIMKKIELPIVPNPQCQELLRKTRLGAYFLLDASFICAGGEVGRDTCRVRTMKIFFFF